MIIVCGKNTDSVKNMAGLSYILNFCSVKWPADFFANEDEVNQNRVQGVNK